MSSLDLGEEPEPRKDMVDCERIGDELLDGFGENTEI